MANVKFPKTSNGSGQGPQAKGRIFIQNKNKAHADTYVSLYSGASGSTDLVVDVSAIFIDASCPIGAIMMRHTPFPTGGWTDPTGYWKICDGTNGTPDLRNLFVMGHTSYDKTVRGSDRKTGIPAHSHVIKIGNVGNHTHWAAPKLKGGKTASVGGHKHKYEYETINNVQMHHGAVKGRYPGDYKWGRPFNKDAQAGLIVKTTTEGDHTHTCSIPTVNTTSAGSHNHKVTIGGATNSGGGSAGDNNPPYYKLAYFQKIK